MYSEKIIAGSPVSLTIPSTIIGLTTQHIDYWCDSATCNAGLTITCTVDNTKYLLKLFKKIKKNN